MEYLITLLESLNFSENSVDTAWLDKLITDRVQSLKPNIFLSLCTAGIHIAENWITEHFIQFENALERQYTNI